MVLHLVPTTHLLMAQTMSSVRPTLLQTLLQSVFQRLIRQLARCLAATVQASSVQVTALQHAYRVQPTRHKSQVSNKSSSSHILTSLLTTVFRHRFECIGSAMKARQYSTYSPAYSPAMSGASGSKAQLHASSASGSKQSEHLYGGAPPVQSPSYMPSSMGGGQPGVEGPGAATV